MALNALNVATCTSPNCLWRSTSFYRTYPYGPWICPTFFNTFSNPSFLNGTYFSHSKEVKNANRLNKLFLIILRTTSLSVYLPNLESQRMHQGGKKGNLKTVRSTISRSNSRGMNEG